jgi:hypothetical protein
MKGSAMTNKATTPKVNWSEKDQKYWVATDAEPLWFESSLDAKAAAHQIEIDNAVKAEREAIVEWLLSQWVPGCLVDYPDLADCIKRGQHLK